MVEPAELTVERVADWARVSPQTVRRWIRNGHLKANKNGRDYRIPVTALTELLDDHTVSATTTGSQ